jgi:hypothetical protein
MDNKKRMMFILEEDYYFITIKLLSILKALECDKKYFADFRKLGLIFELIKNKKNLSLFNRLICGSNPNVLDAEEAVKIFCDSKLDIAVIKRVLFFLEKQQILELKKNNKTGNIDVLLKNDRINKLLEQEILKEDFQRANQLRKTIRGLRSLKLETLQSKVFGYSEVTKWVN